MVESAPTYDFLAELFASYGLMPRGGFHPSPEDGVPGDPQTLIHWDWDCDYDCDFDCDQLNYRISRL